MRRPQHKLALCLSFSQTPPHRANSHCGIIRLRSIYDSVFLCGVCAHMRAGCRGYVCGHVLSLKRTLAHTKGLGFGPVLRHDQRPCDALHVCATFCVAADRIFYAVSRPDGSGRKCACARSVLENAPSVRRVRAGFHKHTLLDAGVAELYMLVGGGGVGRGHWTLCALLYEARVFTGWGFCVRISVSYNIRGNGAHAL